MFGHFCQGSGSPTTGNEQQWVIYQSKFKRDWSDVQDLLSGSSNRWPHGGQTQGNLTFSWKQCQIPAPRLRESGFDNVKDRKDIAFPLTVLNKSLKIEQKSIHINQLL